MDSSMKSFNPNKHLKEQFVSNLTGSSMFELFVLSAIFPMLILLRYIMGICRVENSSTVASRNQGVYIYRMIVDFISIVLPIALFCTVLADWTYMNGGLFILGLLFFAASRRVCRWLICERDVTDATHGCTRSLVVHLATPCIHEAFVQAFDT